MEYFIKNGKVQPIIRRFKAVSDGEGGVTLVPLGVIYRCIGGALKIIWRILRSCFGSGYWQNDMQWDNNDGWNNG